MKPKVPLLEQARSGITAARLPRIRLAYAASFAARADLVDKESAEITVLEFAEAVQSAVGSAVPIVHVEAAEDDPRRRRPDLARDLAPLV